MVDTSNVAQGTLDGKWFRDLSVDATTSDGEDNLVVNIDLKLPRHGDMDVRGPYIQTPRIQP